MNIIHVTGYYPPHVGGIEACVYKLAPELVENGHSVNILTSAIDTPSSATSRPSKHFTIERLGAFEFAHTPIMPGLPRRLWKLLPGRLLHVHLSHAYTDVVSVALSKLRRRPVVLHFHIDVAPSGRFGRLLLLYKSLLLPWVLRAGNRVIVLSAEQRELVLNRYRLSPHRVVVIPNGVDEEWFAEPHPRPARSQGPLRLLFVGRLVPQKNLARLLRATALSKHQVKLDVVGDGELRADLERLARDLGLSNVVFHGFLTGSALRARYSAADVMAIPSDVEGMPLVLLEAMASGLAVVVNAAPGLTEFVEERGLVVHDGTPEEFAKALDQLASDAELRLSLAKAGIEWARGHLWPEIACRVAAVYQAAATEHSGGPATGPPSRRFLDPHPLGNRGTEPAEGNPSAVGGDGPHPGQSAL
jgi:glycosyltransferase involved in cell wall biosynthesis